jgi:phosphopentomutase
MTKQSAINRVILIVLDSVGAGAMPDAKAYCDLGADTLGHIFDAYPNLRLPNMARFGLYNILNRPDLPTPGNVTGAWGKMALKSPAKDTTAGHWELAGIILDKPLPTFPNGFPQDLIEEFERRIGTKVIGNTVASGTEIINRLGDEHCKTGFPIVYTSADSVFQIAAHETCFGLDKLYGISKTAREMLTGNYGVGRVIARPFIGFGGNYTRTPNRKDYSLTPPEKTILDEVASRGGNVVGIGKISDIFAGRGLNISVHSGGNAKSIEHTIAWLKDMIPQSESQKVIIFTNLVDFDMLFGHRRDASNYAKALQYFDNNLPRITANLTDNDLLIITADHGCDPTHTAHTDHTREYVPLLVYSKQLNHSVNLGVRETLADVAQTIADVFDYPEMKNGKSFKDMIL